MPAEAISLQPRTPFETFDPMELVANSTEVADMLERHGEDGGAFVLFTEDNSRPVRMARNLPVRWTSRRAQGAPSYVNTDVTRGSYVTFQLAVFVPAGGAALRNLTVRFGGPWLGELSPTCINLEGVDQVGVQAAFL